MSRYNPKEAEPKWQKRWNEEATFEAETKSKKPKFFVLEMFPYPSGRIHLGHVRNYAMGDVVARYKKANGFNVLHPMGWDSFGLPAEQYAVRTGIHPRITTEKNIRNIKKQLKRLGFSYDWDREIATSDPKYYKWTQWIFTKLYEKNLAYQAELSVNFCPALGTVLANEEIEDGKSKIGGYPVEKRPLKQWVLKITAYAERLLEDLKELDWPESLKKDYRPKQIAGTTYQLAYFKHHPEAKAKAQLANIKDFVTVFIGRNSRLKAYRNARKKMDDLVAKHGKEILLKEQTAIDFINEIGGKPNSYNFRETWPKKVIYIIKRAGLSQLTTDLHNKISFEKSW